MPAAGVGSLAVRGKGGASHQLQYQLCDASRSISEPPRGMGLMLSHSRTSGARRPPWPHTPSLVPSCTSWQYPGVSSVLFSHRRLPADSNRCHETLGYTRSDGKAKKLTSPCLLLSQLLSTETLPVMAARTGKMAHSRVRPQTEVGVGVTLMSCCPQRLIRA